jgi:hypothetical protein
MQYRTMGKLGIRSSVFGLGCMRFNGAPSGDSIIDEEKAVSLIRQAIDGGVTYLDTAYIYLDKTSETVLGKALQDGYRDKVTIATKVPSEAVHNRAEMEALLDEELRKLQTDHIDFYLMHGIQKEKWEYFKSIGAREFFEDMIRAGKIRYKCFSFHGPYEEFAYILNDWDWDMVQIQYNFMDVEKQAGTRGLQLAHSKGIPVVIMEGLLGGALAKAPDNVQALYDAFPVQRSPVEWAFRWLCDHPEVSVVLSGCNEPEQIADNLRIFDGALPNVMTPEEQALIERARGLRQPHPHRLHRLPLLHALPERRGHPGHFRRVEQRVPLRHRPQHGLGLPHDEGKRPRRRPVRRLRRVRERLPAAPAHHRAAQVRLGGAYLNGGGVRICRTPGTARWR